MRVARRRVGAVVVLMACAACPYLSERGAQLDQARALSPTQRPADSSPVDAVTTVIRVRAWVDADYRSQVPRWADAIPAQLDRANAVLAPALGARLALVELREWPRRAGLEPLDRALDALAQQDPGDDVHVVLGFVSSLSVLEASHEALGQARLGGTHAVLRGLESAAEQDAILRVFDKLTDTERRTLYAERRAHKETTVLLHELGHLLGAPHQSDTHGLMYAEYGHRRDELNAVLRALLTTSLEHKLRAPFDLPAWARAVRAQLAADQLGTWDARQLPAWLALLAAADRERSAPQAVATAPEEVLARAERALRDGALDEAARLVEPELQRRPDDPGLGRVGCLTGVRSPTPSDAVRERCERAARAFPDDAALQLAAAALHVVKDDAVAAAAALRRAQALLPAEGHAASWAWFLALARRVGAVSLVEAGAQRLAGTAEAAEASSWARRTRRWRALPVGAVRSEDEVEYVGQQKRLLAELDARAVRPARARLAAFERTFAGTPAVWTLCCEVLAREGRVAEARSACARAVAQDPEAVSAHYLLGVMAHALRRCAEAAPHLERVLALDPDVADARARLAQCRGTLSPVTPLSPPPPKKPAVRDVPLAE